MGLLDPPTTSVQATISIFDPMSGNTNPFVNASFLLSKSSLLCNPTNFGTQGNRPRFLHVFGRGLPKHPYTSVLFCPYPLQHPSFRRPLCSIRIPTMRTILSTPFRSDPPPKTKLRQVYYCLQNIAQHAIPHRPRPLLAASPSPHRRPTLRCWLARRNSRMCCGPMRKLVASCCNSLTWKTNEAYRSARNTPTAVPVLRTAIACVRRTLAGLVRLLLVFVTPLGNHACKGIVDDDDDDDDVWL